MKIDKFYRNSLIVTLSNLATGIIGFVFSIILSRKLGTEGLGLYGIVMPVYGLLLCLTSDGLVTALSRLSAVYCSKKDYKNLNRTLSTIFTFIILWSLTVAGIFFVNTSNIGTYIFKDARISDALKIICPALLFVPMSAILKGYFYGMGKFHIPTCIDIFEKGFRVAVLLGTVSLLSLTGVRETVTAAYLALASGELLSFTLLYIFYRMYKKNLRTGSSRAKHRIQLLFDVLVISCPLCLNGFISSILSTASTLILPRRLVHAGFSYNSALSLIGKFSGMALNITYLPFIIVGSMLTVLVPDISLSISRKDFYNMESRISQVLKISYLIGLSTLITAVTIPGPLGVLFYGRSDLAGMIGFAAAASFVSYVASPTFSMLNGLGKQNVYLRNSTIISVQGLILIFILTGIPAINIYGYGITLIITSLTALMLNIREIRKSFGIKLPTSEIISYTIIGIFVFLILIPVSRLLPDSIPFLKVSLTAALGFSAVFALSRFV